MSQDKSKITDSDKNVHAGHRKRVKEKFMENGFKGFNDHEILELLLFYVVPRRDTNEMAHNLINICGSLSAVFDAPYEFLVEKGLSESAALFLKIIFSMNKKYVEDRFFSETNQYQKEDLRRKLISTFLGLKQEQVVLVLFDTDGTELFYGVISEGSFNASELNIRLVTEMAMKYHAASAVIAHNHPSGIAYPSDTDIESTFIMKEALAKIGVTLSDHFIVASTVINGFTSDPSLLELFL
ncbi:MAG: hypothetical protein IJ192_08570 [Clostridia bacterium]|nr:hypothetical protein [Clostridia bacterium]MBR2176730.1 hypothetical protein [Clostridia bacterium]